MLGSYCSTTVWKCTGAIRTVPSILLSTIALVVILGASSFAAEVVTDSTVYDVGSIVGIDGFTFGSGETVTLQVTELDGTPITGDAGLPWDATSDGTGDFGTSWILDYQGTSSELSVTAVGHTSGLVATTSFVAGATNLDQLQNGTETTPPEWSNGNINSSNSCYSEGAAVPYRAFIRDEGSGTPHYFTIEMEWTKAGIHAFDFLGSYDFSEDSAIDLAGGPCGNVGTSAPEDCTDPADSLEFPDPTLTSNYSGSIPSDFYTTVNPTWEYNDIHYLMAYNAVIDSVGDYYFGGTALNRTWAVEVYYTQVDTGTVGFYWGGHLAQGDPDHWGYGNGSASVSGAPYHMRMKSFDGGGGAGQDRSIQNGTICLPPAAIIIIDADSLCFDIDTTYIAYDTSDANDWLWRVTGGTIIGDSTLSSVEFSVDSTASTVTIELVACNTNGGCPGDFCCTDVTLTLPTASCNHPPEVYCAADDSLFVCELSDICVTGFTSYDADGDALTCTVWVNDQVDNIDGDSVCFTPVEGDNVITYICTDPYGAADTCETLIHVDLNSPPTASCPPSDTVFLCELPPTYCLDGFSCDDPDGNVVSSTVNGVPFGGGQYCFTPVEGDNNLQLICVDACGETDTCQTTITVRLNSAPVADAGPDQSVFLAEPAEICWPASCSDVDGNLTGCALVEGPGIYDNTNICFTTDTPGVYVFVLEATDDCAPGRAIGYTDRDTAVITVTYNSPPVATCPGDTSIFLCELSEICIPGFSCSDVDGNLASCVSSIGTLVGDTVCFTPTGVGVYTITLIATDSLGVADTCATNVTVTVNSPPVASCPGDTALFVCDLTEICLSVFSCTDVDGNLASCVSSIGTLVGDTVCFTPTGVGVYTITLIATDSLGVADTCATNVTVTVNSPPVASCPGDTALFVCDLSPICITGFNCSDVDGNLASCVPSIGTLVGDVVCFTPTGEGAYDIILTATDDCDEVHACTTQVTVTLNSPPVAGCPGDTALFVCDLTEICLSGFSCTDVDGNLTSCVPSIGTLVGDVVCFTPTAEGAYDIILTATDDCDEVHACTTQVTVTLNSAPVAGCPGDTTLFVCDLTQICLSGFSCTDVDGNLASCVPSIGTLVGDVVCFTPSGEGAYDIILTATDDCDEVHACTTQVTVDLNEAPVCDNCPTDDTVFVCDLSEICIGGFEPCFDPDYNLDYCYASPGTLTGSTVCLDPVEGDNTILFICVDSCDAADTCETVIHVVLNSAPVVTCPPNDSMFLCNLSDTCISGFSSYDPDDNLDYCYAIGGTLNGDTVCFTPVAGANTITYVCVDSCGDSAYCQTTIWVDTNSAPVAGCPGDTTLFVCDLTETCLSGFSCTDVDGNLKSCVATGGTLNGNQVCFTPTGEGAYDIILTATDACDEVHACTTQVTVTLNRPPEVTCPDDSTIVTCHIDNTVCVYGFSATDPDGNLKSVTLNGQPYTPGTEYCFVPDSGLNYLVLVAVDSCDASAVCTTIVDVVAEDPEVCISCPIVTIEKTHGTIQGQHELVDVTIDSLYNLPDGGMGGYDFLIAFDASALALQAVIPGPPFYDPVPNGCGWEYFIYRFGPCGSCASGCPTGMVRVFGLAETNNGPNHPDCFEPDPQPATLFTLDFLVTNDRTFECQYIPIYFFWCDCADNTISDSTGNHLYLDEIIYDFEGRLIWDEDDDDEFPEDARIPWVGAPDYCIDPDPGKPTPIRCLDFWNGGIDIVCADSIDARGDINLNGTSNEIADAVLFSNYFVKGISVFNVNVNGQIAASDVNADGLTLSVADLVYLIRIIVGDAAPYFKQAPLVIKTDLTDGVLSVGASLGAAWVVLDGEHEPELLAPQMEMKYHYDAESDLTRILVYSMKKGHTFDGAFLAGLEGKVVTFEAATYEGAPVAARLVPDQFALHQCYPNPFNPTTTISFALAEASDYKLTVYNTLGREVQSFTGHGQPGIVEIQWNADGHASGIYFYRLTAGDFTDTKKMVLLK